jgi:uncharacterized Zn finger protein (UPF0148 family)
MIECSECGVEVPVDEVVYCSYCGVPLCSDCGGIGFCSNCEESLQEEEIETEEIGEAEEETY